MADIDLAAKRHATVRGGEGGPAWGDKDAADHAEQQVKRGTLLNTCASYDSVRQGLEATMV